MTFKQQIIKNTAAKIRAQLETARALEYTPAKVQQLSTIGRRADILCGFFADLEPSFDRVQFLSDCSFTNNTNLI